MQVRQLDFITLKQIYPMNVTLSLTHGFSADCIVYTLNTHVPFFSPLPTIHFKACKLFLKSKRFDRANIKYKNKDSDL